MAGGNFENSPVRENQSELLPSFGTVSAQLREANLDRAGITRMMEDATQPMPGTGISSEHLESVRIYTDEDLEAIRKSIPEIDDTTLKMFAIWQADGRLSDSLIQGYRELNEADKTTFLVDKMGQWMDDPDAAGKDTLTANMGVQSMLGGSFREGRTMDVLGIQSVDVLLGSNVDNHVNAFYANNLTGESIAAMDEMLANLQEAGKISEDQYFDAADKYDGKTMTMVAMGNNVKEMTASTDALRTRFAENHPGKTPEDALKAYCEAHKDEGWDYDAMIADINDPTSRHGDNKNAYRAVLANGEWPSDADDATKDACNLLMAESITKHDTSKSAKDNALDANNLMREALTAGIDAFRNVLEKSALGQKLLVVCNNFVHTPPINGTLFQEIWDLDRAEVDDTHYGERVIPPKTPERQDDPKPGPDDPGSSTPDDPAPDGPGDTPDDISSEEESSDDISSEEISSEEESSDDISSEEISSEEESSDDISSEEISSEEESSEEISSEEESSEEISSEEESSEEISSEEESSEEISSEEESSEEPSSEEESSEEISSEEESSEEPSSEEESSEEPSSEEESSEEPSSEEESSEEPSSEYEGSGKGDWIIGGGAGGPRPGTKPKPSEDTPSEDMPSEDDTPSEENDGFGSLADAIVENEDFIVEGDGARQSVEDGALGKYERQVGDKYAMHKHERQAEQDAGFDGPDC